MRTILDIRSIRLQIFDTSGNKSYTPLEVLKTIHKQTPAAIIPNVLGNVQKSPTKFVLKG